MAATIGNAVRAARRYDVVVAGGGLVGCALACALAKNTKLSSQRILLLEGSPETKFSLNEQHSNRVSALNHSTKKLMTSIGVWKHVEKMRLQSVKNMQVWDACSDALITFNHDNLENNVAYIVENDVLLHAINEELNSSENPNQVEVIHSAKISNYSLPADGSKDDCIVNLHNGDSYSCSLLLGADGANSKVRQAMKTQYLAWNYNQMGVVATLKLRDSVDNNNTAWQRFLPSGPVAILPLDSSHSSLVWSTSPEEARNLIKMPEENFIESLNSALHKQFPRNQIVDNAMNALSGFLSAAFLPSGLSRQLPPTIESVLPNSRAGFPLGFGHSTRYIANGVALVGDAAHRVHPLAGQGVNLGFGDVSTIVELLANAIYCGANINDKSYLLDYETRRQRHVVPTAATIDALQKLYNTDSSLIVLLRSLGLQITHAVPPVKKFIMNHAMA